MSLLLDSGWRVWYRGQHQAACATKTGNEFETYVASSLRHRHLGFMNPDPAGAFGDGGCDGITNDGLIVYACYGSRQILNAERALVTKMETDFSRGKDEWDAFETWRFVTNARVGPKATAKLIEFNVLHDDSSARPISCVIWEEEELWTHVLAHLTNVQLNELLPGVPSAENVELADLIPLLDSLSDASAPVETGTSIKPVPAEKMDFNELPLASQHELGEGRLLAPSISEWFIGQADLELRDRCAAKFRRIYAEFKRTAGDSRSILERMYTSIGGSDFRLDSQRANAVYAVVSYFFDACDIFEEPPEDWAEGQANAASN